jgi:SRSO17 transposase
LSQAVGVKWNDRAWHRHAATLPQFLIPLIQELGRSERRDGAALYVKGLLMPGQRKSIEPMAQRLGVDAQRLQQFITDSPWEEAGVWRAIRQEVIQRLEPLEAWIVDETGWLKQGTHSVGVAHQYCGAVGKKANCQINVQVTVTDGQVAAPIGARLYLPESWIEDRPRCRQAGVPEEVGFATKPQMALEMVAAALADGVPQAPVLGDFVYGINGPFRDGLRKLGLEFFLQIDQGQLVGWAHPVEVEKKTKHWHVKPGPPPAQSLVALWAQQKTIRWHALAWKAADGKTRQTRLAWMKVYLPSALDRGAETLEELWLVADWPKGQTQPYHFYLAHLHRAPAPSRCLRLSRSRWNVEQYFQRAKDDLGLDHFEGRSWRGFHHHLMMAVLAYLFVVVIYLRAKKNFWCDVGTDVGSDAAVAAEADRLLQLLRDKME